MYNYTKKEIEEFKKYYDIYNRVYMFKSLEDGYFRIDYLHDIDNNIYKTIDIKHVILTDAFKVSKAINTSPLEYLNYLLFEMKDPNYFI